MALPCYNEGKNIFELLLKFQTLNKVYGNIFETKVLIIDDCSTDNTLSEINRFKAQNPELDVNVIIHEKNKGLTGGINSAFNYFKKHLDIVDRPLAYGLMDGDNSHNPLFIPDMVDQILRDRDVVVASRYRKGSKIFGVSAFRQTMSLGLAFIFKFLRNLPGILDYSCGYRLYSPRIVDRVTRTYGDEIVKEKSFASMVEVLIKCHLQKAIFYEVPFVLRYDQKLGESKMEFKKTILGNLKLLGTLRGQHQ